MCRWKSYDLGRNLIRSSRKTYIQLKFLASDTAPLSLLEGKNGSRGYSFRRFWVWFASSVQPEFNLGMDRHPRFQALNTFESWICIKIETITEFCQNINEFSRMNHNSAVFVFWYCQRRSRCIADAFRHSSFPVARQLCNRRSWFLFLTRIIAISMERKSYCRRYSFVSFSSERYLF